MSTNRNLVIRQARRFMRDHNESSYACPQPVLEAFVQAAMLDLSSRAGYQVTRTPAKITIGPSTGDYLLDPATPPTRETRYLHALILDSNGWELEKVSPEHMDLFRRHEGKNAVGTPRWYQTEENENTTALQPQTQTIRIWPKSSVPDSLTTVQSLVPAELTTGTTVIPFGADLANALAWEVALLGSGAIDPKQREQLHVGLTDQLTDWATGKIEEWVEAERQRVLMVGQPNRVMQVEG